MSILSLNGTDVTHIIHIADIHVRTGDKKVSRSIEYEYVFNKFVSNIKKLDCIKNNTALIIIAGDLFHNKGKFETEGTTILFEFINNLLNLAPVIIIAGNHDFRQEDPTYTDTIDMLVRPYKYTSTKYPIHYLKQTATYRWNNLCIGMCSVKETLRTFNTAGIVSELPQFPKPLNDSGIDCNVALFHGSISQSALPNGRTVDSITHGYPLEWFRGYDIAVLGDNHKQQINNGLDNTLKWGYPGSLIQQDDGESTFGHGYILWDIKTKTAEAFHIPNIYGAITIIRNNTSFYIRYSSTNIKPLNDEIEEDYFPNRPKVRLVNCSEYYNEIEQLLNSKGINPYIIKKTKAIGKEQIEQNVPVDKQINIINDMNSPKQWDDYIKTECPTFDVSDIIYNVNKLIINTNSNLPQTIISKIKKRNIDIQKYIDKYDSVLQSIDTHQYEICIKNMEWEYLMCYGENNYLDFESLDDGIALLNGPNASGKSSFLDVFCIGIFGEPTSSRSELSSDIKLCVNVIHDSKPTDKSACITIEFTVDKELYEITRSFGHNDINKVVNVCMINKIIETEDDTVIELIAEGTQTVNAWIAKRFGKLEDMLMSSILCQMDNTSYFYRTISEQKEILDKSMNLQTISAYQEILDESINANKYILNDITTHLEGIQSTIQNKDTIDLTKRLTILKQDILTQTAEIDTVTTEIKEILMKIGDIRTVERSEDIDETIQSMQDLHEQYISIDKEQIQLYEKQLSNNISLNKSLLPKDYTYLNDINDNENDNKNDNENDNENKLNETILSHQAIKPNESNLSISYIKTKRKEYEAWCDKHNPSKDTGVLDNLYSKHLKLETKLKELNDTPVIKPANYVVSDINPNDTLETLTCKELELTKTIKDIETYKPNKPNQTHQQLEHVIKQYNTWAANYPSEWIDNYKTMPNNIPKSDYAFNEASKAFDDILLQSVVKPTSIKPTITTTNIYTIENLKTINIKLKRIQNPIQFSKKKEDYGKWQATLKKWNELCEFYNLIGSESLQQLSHKRDILMESKTVIHAKQALLNNLNETLVGCKKDVDEIKRIPYNSECWACKEHHNPSQTKLNNTIKQIEKIETRIASETKTIDELTTILKSQSIDELNKQIAKRQEYEANVNIMQHDIIEWEKSVIAWKEEEARLVEYNRLEQKAALIEWNLYEKYMESYTEITQHLEKTRSDNIILKNFCIVAPSEIEKYNNALNELDVSEKWQIWYDKYTIINNQLENTINHKYSLWNKQKTETINEIEKLNKFKKEYDAWKTELPMLDKEYIIAEKWDKWQQRDLYLTNTKIYFAIQKSIEEYKKIAEALTVINNYEKYQKTIWLNELEDLEHQLKELKLCIGDTTKDITMIEKELSEIDITESQTVVISEEKDKIKDTLDKLTKFKDLFIGTKKNGDGFKAMLYREKVLPLIMNEVNNFLEELVDFKFIIKQHNTKITYLICDRNNTFTLSHASGFQKFVVGLAMRATLCKIGASGQSLKHLFIDEGFVCCDVSNIQQSERIVRVLMHYGRYRSILLISHLDVVRDISEKTINITRDTGKFSYVRYGKNKPKRKIVKRKKLANEVVEKKPRGRPRKIVL